MRREIKGKRSAYEKHFINSDGTFECEIYPERIHYLNNGVYEEIDNTLIDKGGVIQNKQNDLQVKFEKENSKRLFSLDFHNKSFKMGLENGNKVKGKKDKNKVKYDEILDGIDAYYEVLPNKVKEQIVIKDKSGIKDKLIFNLNTDLELKKIDDELVLLDEEKIFTIEKPFMVDSNGNYNNDIYYDINPIDQGYEIILNLDIDWLNKATFPVIIDPTIVKEDREGMLDTYIKSDSPTVNYGTSEILKVSKNNNEERTLIKFGLPVIGTGSNVIDAKLLLAVNNYECDNRSMVSMHKINTPWSPNTATWNSMNNKYEEQVEDYNMFYKQYVPNDNLIVSTFNITNLVKKWYSGEPNYGVMLKVYDNTNFNLSYFSNDNTVNNDIKPLIVITYRNQNGLEGYMTYQQMKLTHGNVYANNYNGNITTLFNLGSTLNGKLPANLNLYYNTNDVILNKDYGFGIGNKLNFNQTIKKVTIENEEMYEYIDEDGTIHYFVEKKEDDTSLGYFDEDGLSLELIVNENNCTIKDKDNNKMYFEKNSNEYRLTKIINSKNDEINIVYENNKIVKIKDGNNEEINITYGNNIVITSLSKTTTITLTNNRLTKISDNIGETNIDYTNNLISSITDVIGKKIEFEYYNVNPYRIKTIQEKGKNDTLGKSLTFDYDFETTIITDEKGMIQTNTFNSIGNTVSKTVVDGNDAYGKNSYYGESGPTKNKLIFEEDMMKYIDNYIYNSSFEKEDLLFTGNVSFSNTYKRTGLRSLKIEGNTTFTQSVEANNYYTFSLYSISNEPFTVKLNSKEITVNNSNDFVRSELTIYVDTDTITIEILPASSVYIDDIQLEKGKVANAYNLIDNGNFRYGLSGFIYGDNEVNYNEDCTLYEGDELLTINGKKVFKRDIGPNGMGSFSKKIVTNGEVGDIYFLSFWYKNTGLNYGEDYKSSHVYTQLIPTDLENGAGLIFGVPLNKNDKEWQFYSRYIVAEYPYSRIDINMMSLENVNDLMFTDFTLVKSSKTNLYKYDDEGNLISYLDENDNETKFKYDKNNQLIKMTDPKGNNLSYEYDRDIKTKVISGISQTGITNEIKYDNFNNPVTTIISNKTVSDITNGLYYLRLKGTNSYLKIDPVTKKLIVEEDTCSHQKFEVIKNEKIVLKPNFYADYYTNNYEPLNNLEYEYIKQDNGSFILKNNNKYLTYNNGFILSETEDIDNQQIYFEKIDSKFIENDATYSEDGKFLTSTTDSLLNKTLYETNDKGIVTSITDSLNNTTNYTYNDKDELVKIKKGDMEVDYEYDNNLLSKIIQANKEYSFIYDDFLNVKTIKVNNNTLITHNYEENNGNLLNSTYGNDAVVSYEYDNFNRVSKITKGTDTYNLYYDNFNNLKKIESNDITYIYSYDLSQRLTDYVQNNFRIHYDYDENNLLLTKKHNNYTYNYEYDTEDNIKKITHDNVTINYNYDELNRLTNKSINNYVTNYDYLNKGNRTSSVVNKLIESDNTFEYEYDKLGNITKIYKNNNLINSYKYDQYNQLIEEVKDNQKITYEYDNFGNILNKKTYQNDILTNTDTYSYENNDWKDQLTKFNGEIIKYDAIGNIDAIIYDEEDIDKGKGIRFFFENGRQLTQYINRYTGEMYQYKYNKDGIRTAKIVGKYYENYYVEGNKIIFRQKQNDVVYFIYDVDNVIGFVYNNETYYYNKNLQNDVIGIRNSNNETIVNYEYDSWGNILSVTDNNNKDIPTKVSNIATINPFRYRSYYYDDETELYYLNSRYYNPKWGRFINADGIIGANEDIISHNLYAYCSNNPINSSDEDGTSIFSSIVIGVAVAAAVKAFVGFEFSVVGSKTEEKITTGRYPLIYGSESITVTETYYKIGRSDKLLNFSFTVDVLDAGNTGLEAKANAFNGSIRLKGSPNDVSLTAGYNGKGLYNYVRVGIEPTKFGNIYTGIGTSGNIVNGLSVSADTRINGSPVIPAAVYACANGLCCPTPAPTPIIPLLGY